MIVGILERKATGSLSPIFILSGSVFFFLNVRLNEGERRERNVPLGRMLL